MKTLAVVALCGATSVVHAQDLVVCVDDIDGDGRWTVSAEFFGSLPGATTAIATIWSDTNFVIGGDGSAITIDAGATNPAYSSDLFGDPVISNGPSASFVGVMPVAPLGNPDSSNPLSVTEFDYFGDPSALTFALQGQNTAAFTGDPTQPFGTILNYLDVNNNPGPLTYRVDIKIPAPASAAVLGLGGLVAVRRRR